MITLVLGGARSGKSALAEQLVSTAASPQQNSSSAEVLYVATARPWAEDSDFLERIALHQRRRPSHWITEEHSDLVDVLDSNDAPHVLVDDLGTWLTEQFNRFEAWPDMKGSRDDVRERVDKLVQHVQRASAKCNLVLVTPEVGMSVIPESAAGRAFRDEIGALNARIARVADKVLLVVAGCTLTLKSEKER